ncbi:MAG: transposase [Lachnospiraceae bacterium]|nr:transposase [Lachnospiraceae bacterium]
MERLYLPPYSPDFNPIEKCGQRLRHICVKQKSVHC